jgi:hypothetical protein
VRQQKQQQRNITKYMLLLMVAKFVTAAAIIVADRQLKVTSNCIARFRRLILFYAHILQFGPQHADGDDSTQRGDQLVHNVKVRETKTLIKQSSNNSGTLFLGWFSCLT